MKLAEQQEYAVSLEISNTSYQQCVHELQASVEMLNGELGNAKSEMHVLMQENNNLEMSLTSKSNQLDELQVSFSNIEAELKKHEDVIALINKISNKAD
jgi:predicted nuclease with TOPRIM domain